MHMKQEDSGRCGSQIWQCRNSITGTQLKRCVFFAVIRFSGLSMLQFIYSNQVQKPVDGCLFLHFQSVAPAQPFAKIRAVSRLRTSSRSEDNYKAIINLIYHVNSV